MKLPELISLLSDPGDLGRLLTEMNANTASETLLIYMKHSLDLESEVIILPIEWTEDDLVIEKDGAVCYQLFSLDTTVELIEFDLDLRNKGYSDLEIAIRLLEYRLNDA
jgi:hypothetical protein